jgi:hypothetical protein
LRVECSFLEEFFFGKAAGQANEFKLAATARMRQMGHPTKKMHVQLLGFAIITATCYYLSRYFFVEIS